MGCAEPGGGHLQGEQAQMSEDPGGAPAVIPQQTGQISEPARARPRQWRYAALLALIVAVQTALALLQHNSAFIDEATYLYAGHNVISRALHGGGPVVSGWGSYFSGAPFFYPVIGAAFDDLGGLAAARCYSLVLMAASTLLLYGTTVRIFDRRAACFAAAVFATAPSVIFLSYFATYDAQALFLIALAFWLAARAAEADRARWQAALAVLSGVCLGAATVSKYASLALGAPVIILAGLLYARRLRGWRALGQCGLVVAGMAAVTGAVLAIDGSDLVGGLRKSTLDRPAAGTTASPIVREFIQLGGAVFLLAYLGSLLYLIWPSVHDRRAGEGWALRAALAATLTLAALIGLADQIHVQTTVSFHKHIAFGLLFTAPMAGLLLARLSRFRFGLAGPRLSIALLTVLAIGFVALGYQESQRFYDEWPNTATEASELSPYIGGGQDQILVESPDVLQYDFRTRLRQNQWDILSTFTYHDRATGRYLTGVTGLKDAMVHHYFTVIVFTADTPPDASLENQLTPMLPKNDYDVVAHVSPGGGSADPPFTIWLLVDK
jgi:Dolichyl-phosphate-mannose-protein mannosyltransferase